MSVALSKERTAEIVDALRAEIAKNLPEGVVALPHDVYLCPDCGMGLLVRAFASNPARATWEVVINCSHVLGDVGVDPEQCQFRERRFVI